MTSLVDAAPSVNDPKCDEELKQERETAYMLSKALKNAGKGPSPPVEAMLILEKDEKLKEKDAETKVLEARVKAGEQALADAAALHEKVVAHLKGGT